MPADLARQMARLALCAWPRLPACQTVLDVVGDLFADGCQVEEFFLDDGIFGLFGKLSIRGRLLPEIVVPLHTFLPRKDVNVRFASKATEVLRCRELTRCDPS